MIVTRRSVLTGAALLFTASVARAGSTADLLARIAKARAPMRTLQGPFTQTRTIGLLSTDVRSTGVFALVRPDRLRWHLAPPDDVTFWVGPEGLAYRSAHGQGRVPASSARIAAALQDLHALLGGDLAEFEAVAAAPDGSAGSPGATRRMRFALAPDLVRPTRALLVEGDQDRTAIEFGDLTVNGPVDESSMRPPV
jgi:hypothetical protein